MAKEEFTWEVWEVERGVPDICAASVTSSNLRQLEREIAHYLFVCGQDGPVEVRPVK